MPLYLLDTNHVRLLEQCSLPFMRQYLRRIPDVALCAISVQEVLKGRLAAISVARTATDLMDGYQYLVDSLAILAQLPIIPYDPDCEFEFQSLRTFRPKTGKQDQRIAATALAKNLTLVTSNTKDFAGIPGLQLADWSK